MNTAAIHFARGKSVKVGAREGRHLGTDTTGGRNVDRLEIAWRGYTMEGRWDGDGRHLIEVSSADVPAEALPLLEAIRAARRSWSGPTEAQLALLAEAGYSPAGKDLRPEVPTAAR